MCHRPFPASATVIALSGALIAFAAYPALADDDDDALSAEQESDTYVMRDARGTRTGTLEKERDGYLIQRNTKGTRVGTWELEPTGNQWIVRDTAGRRLGTVERR